MAEHEMMGIEEIRGEVAQAALDATVTALAQAERRLEYVEKVVTYDLPTPVLVEVWGHKYVVSKIRRRDVLEGNESFTDIEGYSAEATAKGVANKRAVKIWRSLPNETASAIAF